MGGGGGGNRAGRGLFERGLNRGFLVSPLRLCSHYSVYWIAFCADLKSCQVYSKSNGTQLE